MIFLTVWCFWLNSYCSLHLHVVAGGRFGWCRAINKQISFCIIYICGGAGNLQFAGKFVNLRYFKYIASASLRFITLLELIASQCNYNRNICNQIPPAALFFPPKIINVDNIMILIGLISEVNNNSECKLVRFSSRFKNSLRASKHRSIH